MLVYFEHFKKNERIASYMVNEQVHQSEHKSNAYVCRSRIVSERETCGERENRQECKKKYAF